MAIRNKILTYQQDGERREVRRYAKTFNRKRLKRGKRRCGE